MSEGFDTQKGIHEDMTVMELAIMMNNGFNTMFGLYKELRDDVNMLKVDMSILKDDVTELKHDVQNIKIDMSNFKTDFNALEKTVSRLEKRTENIESNMVTSFEFKNLILRTEKVEEIMSI